MAVKRAEAKAAKKNPGFERIVLSGGPYPGHEYLIRKDMQTLSLIVRDGTPGFDATRNQMIATYARTSVLATNGRVIFKFH
jgi:hypothetical protein